MRNRNRQKGVALIICMVFVVIFSALSTAMLEMSTANIQISNNHSQSNTAFVASQSGLEIVRYWLNGIVVPGSVLPDDRLEYVTNAFLSNLSAANITNITASYDAATALVTISAPSTGNNIILDSLSSQGFSAVLTQPDADTLQIEVTGTNGNVDRHLRASCSFVETAGEVFSYGIATKGALEMTGQASIQGVNQASDAHVYIEGFSTVCGDSLLMTGQSNIAYDVDISHANATYSINDEATVAGASGNGVDDHITVGVEQVTFPQPDPGFFRSFATGDVIDSSTDISSYSVLENVTIAANTNPVFAGNITVNGILFVESPNIVHFSGQSSINGIIAGDGDMTDTSSTDKIKFTGQVESQSVSTLVGSQFDDIRDETGTFIVAPGFEVEFAGQSNTINGAIAASGIRFTGQGGGTVNGSLINYSEEPLRLTGQGNLSFDLSGNTDSPSGFVADQVLEFQPASYSEILP